MSKPNNQQSWITRTPFHLESKAFTYGKCFVPNMKLSSEQSTRISSSDFLLLETHSVDSASCKQETTKKHLAGSLQSSVIEIRNLSFRSTCPPGGWGGGAAHTSSSDTSSKHYSRNPRHTAPLTQLTPDIVHRLSRSHSMVADHKHLSANPSLLSFSSQVHLDVWGKSHWHNPPTVRLPWDRWEEKYWLSSAPPEWRLLYNTHVCNNAVTSSLPGDTVSMVLEEVTKHL